MMGYIGRALLGHARVVTVLLAIALVVMVAETGFAADGDTTLASVDSSGNQADNASEHSSISADGRFVAFESTATNLVTGDTNNASDVFVHDLQSGTTERVSLDSSENQANGQSYEPSISDDGRYVAFHSSASNLPDDFRNGEDVFVRDRQSGTTELVSVDSSEKQGNNASYYPSISADGRFVAFKSFATNLVSTDTNDKLDVFVRDRQDGTTQRASLDSSGKQGNDHAGSANGFVTSHDHSISGDGLHVAFHSTATNLVTSDTSGFPDVFVHEVDKAAPTLDTNNSYSVEPDSEAPAAARLTSVWATFPEAMDPATLEDPSTFTLARVDRDGSTTPLPATVSCVDDPCKTVKLDPFPSNPKAKLARRMVYKATITTAATDLAGNALDGEKSWTFTTGRR